MKFFFVIFYVVIFSIFIGMTPCFRLFGFAALLLLLSSNVWSIGLNSIPTKTSKVELLTRKVVKHAETEEERVRAIFLWITDNIKYDVNRYLKPTAKCFTTKQTLRRRKAICTEYADLFSEMCGYAGVMAIKVEGFAKDWFYENDDLIYGNNHAWNIAFVNGKWCLYDLTFASGYLGLKSYFYEKIRPPVTIYFFPVVTKSKMVFHKKRNDLYYKTPPEIFIENHLPDVPMFQLLSNNLTIEDFEYNLKESSQKEINDFNSQIAYLNRNAKDYGMIWIGDSSAGFNCKNKADQVGQYFKAADEQLNLLDENSKRKAIELIDTAIVMSKEASVLVTEDFNYRLRKNVHRNQLMNKDFQVYKKWSSNRSMYWLRKSKNALVTRDAIEKYILITENRKGIYESWRGALSFVKQVKDTTGLSEIVPSNNETIQYLRDRIANLTDSMIKDATADTFDLSGLELNILNQELLLYEMVVYTERINNLRVEHLDQLDSLLLVYVGRKNAIKEQIDSLYEGFIFKVKNEQLNTKYFKQKNKALSKLVNAYMNCEIDNAKYGVLNGTIFNAYLDTILANFDVLLQRYNNYQDFLDFQEVEAMLLSKEYKAEKKRLLRGKMFEQHRLNYKARYLSRRRKFEVNQLIEAKYLHRKIRKTLKYSN